MSYSLTLFALVAATAAPCIVSADTTPPPATVAPTPQKSIDQQLDELKTERDRCKLRAKLAGQKADELMTRDWLGYCRAIRVQEMNEHRMKMIDERIKILEQKKASSAQK
ncbi:MAG: hypothetical protein JSR46_11560 [Verrucomicrobia bacterium]|nr:hypothetical protein [Verrucomicrobiota bacterium]